MSKRAAIIGASGYGGVELVRILARHPQISELKLGSRGSSGKKIAEVYPNFTKLLNNQLLDPEEVINDVDIVFSALPNGLAEQYAALASGKNIPFIDLSADFRFADEEIYKEWYGSPYKEPLLHEHSVYGLPEMNREKIKKMAAGEKAPIIGNPGCYPTASTLGALPALKHHLNAPGATIIFDAASGITGGGREPQRSFHFPEANDSMTAYKVGAHRHTPEIQGNCGGIPIIFTPHLVPLNRGILSTIYIPLKQPIAEDEARGLYENFYRNEPFVRVLPKGLVAATGPVRRSNYCDISVHLSYKKDVLIIISAIDNMVKGAAGQAVQNMNIIFGFEETAGLQEIPALF
ncbi:MAG: N-acetyl-gamma-glutamyl-phosphate reductase [Spirochaetaceae bacterium]|jgi:N-acetyl-gamma-glutamyl-phosphate reductase|nr:N-acetyl-gamma-glutamyl-phosphate reductase [Spirochaetaceae bacterium]